VIERYAFHERICHWLTGISYVYCLATGLAFYTPYLFWLAIVLGGGPTSRFWHPFLGLVFFGAVLWMHALWRDDMTLTAADRKWLAESEKYAQNRDDELPPQNKFNGGQKVFYWAMFYGAFLLILSGLFMWFPESIPASMKGVRPVFVFVHEGAALITIGAFIIHLYMGLFMVPGSTTAMIHGYVTRAWARTHHRLWYDRVVQKPIAPE
jgi:formate dehydrogenase subunit gamma